MDKAHFYYQWTQKKKLNILDPIMDFISDQASTELDQLSWSQEEAVFVWVEQYLDHAHQKKVAAAYRKKLSRETNLWKEKTRDAIELGGEESMMLAELAKLFNKTKRQIIRDYIKKEYDQNISKMLDQDVAEFQKQHKS
jgi:hypothetical protein